MYEDLKEEHLDHLHPKIYGLDDSLLERIGINLPKDNLPYGYLRAFNEDFIVEEIGFNGEYVSTVEPDESVNKLPPKTDSKQKTLWVDLVKTKLTTLDAVDIIAHTYGLKVEDIGYAGLKDDQAFTSQRLAIRNWPKAVDGFKDHPHYFLKNATWAQNILKKGQLHGNSFTILVRTAEPVSEDYIREKIDHFDKDGFVNFYGEQRFGTPRFLNAALGAMILRAEYEKVLRTFVTGSSPWEADSVAAIRSQALASYGEWTEMKRVFSVHPYPFRHELILLEHLINSPKDFVGALKSIASIVQIWVYSYASFAFNHKLSQIVEGKHLNLFGELPLITSSNAEDRSLYKKILEKHHISNMEKAISPFANIKLVPRKIPTKLPFLIRGFKTVPQGIVIAFSLPKAAYATIFLRNFFRIVLGKPTPEWVQSGDVDVKQILGAGSVNEVKQILAN